MSFEQSKSSRCFAPPTRSQRWRRAGGSGSAKKLNRIQRESKKVVGAGKPPVRFMSSMIVNGWQSQLSRQVSGLRWSCGSVLSERPVGSGTLRKAVGAPSSVLSKQSRCRRGVPRGRIPSGFAFQEQTSRMSPTVAPVQSGTSDASWRRRTRAGGRVEA